MAEQIALYIHKKTLVAKLKRREGFPLVVSTSLDHLEGCSLLYLSLFDAEEQKVDEITRHLYFDLTFLSERILEVAEAVTEELSPAIYLFRGTEVPAALMAAERRPELFGAVVGIDGRTDLLQEEFVLPELPVELLYREEKQALYQKNQKRFGCKFYSGDGELEAIFSLLHSRKQLP